MTYRKSKIENGETRYVDPQKYYLEHLISDYDEGFTEEEAHFLNRELLAMYQVRKWLLSSVKEIYAVIEMYKDSQEELPSTNASFLRDETLEIWKAVHTKLFEVYNFAAQEYKFDQVTRRGAEPKDTIRSLVESQDHIDNVRKAFGEEIPLAQPKYLEAMGEVLAKHFGGSK